MKNHKAQGISKGLYDADVERSAAEHGRNVFSNRKPKSFLRCFLENLGDPVIKILLAALAVNIFLAFRGNDIIETIGIAISVFLSTLISTLSERGSEAAFRRLDAECSASSYRVYRNGRLCEISIEELVVGDVLKIGAGEQIPADAFITHGNIKVDQSMLTGESREISKAYSMDKTKTPSSKSAVFRGCPVLSGEAEIEIFAVGEETFLGKISDEVKLDTRESPLKVRLSKLARQISILGYIAAFLIAFAYLFNILVIDSGFEWQIILQRVKTTHYIIEKLLHAFMLGLTVIVMAVPEGLPMMIAVILSSNIKKMTKDNVLVRKPVGIEAAGSMNILFTDKTGTVTEGKMSVGAIIDSDAQSYQNLKSFKKSSKKCAELYLASAYFNTLASISGKNIIGGNATEKALSASLLTYPFEKEIKGYTVLERLPFDSALKYSAVTLAAGSERLILVKGAPEKLLPSCKYAYNKNGSRIAFSSVAKGILEATSRLTSEGKRILWITESESMPRGHQGTLTFVCAVALLDKIRPEAKSSTEALRNAGIGVVMITGDNKETAEHIARECGIINKSRSLVLESAQLASLSDSELKLKLPTLAVVARALPQDKSRLVRLSQEEGLVVGMTGDGINDAPALKRADIGFAMGNGTSVAKEASDIIIIDSNLSSISKAVLYGRTIFKSIRKFITLQLTMNFCAVGISMIGPFIGFDSPVTVVQMLWINIIMDTLGGLAFAGESPIADYMKEPPKKREEPILNGAMVFQIAFSVIFTVAIFLAFLLCPAITSQFRASSDNAYLLSAFFALFIFASVFHCFNARTDRLKIFSNLSKNKPFIFIMILILAVQLIFIYLGGKVLRTVPLNPKELKITLLVAISVFPAELLRKIFLRIIGRKSIF